MAGHSHAKNVMNRKNAMDKKKAKVFTKIAKLITIAIKQGGSNDPGINPRLRLALKMAQNANVPKDIIKKALDNKKDSSKKYEEVVYEGYLGKIAILISALTDNKNKTAPEIRCVLSKNNGSIAQPNSVAFMFDKVAIIECQVEEDKSEEFFMDAVQAGASEVIENTAYFPPELFHQAQEEIEKNWKITLAELSFKTNTTCSDGNKEELEKLIEEIEENDSVQGCWHNYIESSDEN